MHPNRAIKSYYFLNKMFCYFQIFGVSSHKNEIGKLLFSFFANVYYAYIIYANNTSITGTWTSF